jgi:SAM-dependent methyltransferase
MSAPRDQYEDVAAEYAAENEDNAWNALYERPAALALLGDVAGLRVLDVGCGAGAHARELIARGARVEGLDRSPALLRIARERLGPDVPLHEADLEQPLPLADGAFDRVLASLVLHYVEDQRAPLLELRRVLAPGGRLVLSVHHPAVEFVLSGSDDYFATELWTDVWTIGGRDVPMRFWRRPLHEVTDALTDAGFVIERLAEPQPLPETAERFPREHRLLATRPRFLFVVAR